MMNSAFDSHNAEFRISNVDINLDAFNVIVGSPSGIELELSYSIHNEIKRMILQNIQIRC